MSPRYHPASRARRVGRPEPQGDPRLPHPGYLGDRHRAHRTEVKSLRNGKASIKEAYARVRNGEVFLEGMNITPYEQGNRYNHDPVRTRKLLLHRREIEKLIGAVEQKGLTLVPLELYFRNGRAKVALALGRGKKHHDKREDLKRRVVRARGGARRLGSRGPPVIAGLLLAARAGLAAACPGQITVAGVAGRRPQSRCGRCRAEPRWSRAPALIAALGAVGADARRMGRGDRGPPAVPLPGRRAALPLQQPAPAARRRGLARAATRSSCRSSSSPRSCRTIWASATATTRAPRRLDDVAAAAVGCRAAGPRPSRRLPNGLRPGHIGHGRPGPRRRGPGQSRRLLSRAASARRTSHCRSACCCGTSSSGAASACG